MTAYVVDTNVAVVANRGIDVTIDDECHRTCTERLDRLIECETVAVDELGLILDEYADRLCWSGGPRIGDRFFVYVFNNQHREDRVRRVAVTPLDDEGEEFEELPENKFDRSDRKFLAVAVVADAVVLNATDGDWSENQALMDELGVEVEELCPHEIHRKRRGRG